MHGEYKQQLHHHLHGASRTAVAVPDLLPRNGSWRQ